MILGLNILNIRISVKYKSNNSSSVHTFLRNSKSHLFFLESPIFLLISSLSPSTPYTKKWHTLTMSQYAKDVEDFQCIIYRKVAQLKSVLHA